MKSITVLKLKVSSDSHEELERIAVVCRKARNAGLEDWLLRQRGKPESAMQAAPSTRRTKRFPNGEPRPKEEQTKIYHAIRAEAPSIHTSIAPRLAGDVWSNINADLDWRRQPGQSDEDAEKSERRRKRKRSDAIVNYEDRPPWFTALEIPVPNVTSALACGDQLFVSLRNPLGEGDIKVELSIRDIPPAWLRILRRVSLGKLRLPDAVIRYHKTKNCWYWKCSFTETVDPPKSEVVAHLYATFGNPEKRGRDNFYRLVLPGRSRPWHIGDGRYLRSNVLRLVGIRKMIGLRYRFRKGAGHGRKKVDEAMARRWEQQACIFDEVRRRAIHDIVVACQQHGVGTLIYHEPSLPLRDRTWFGIEGLDWDHTRFASDLSNALAKPSVRVSCAKTKYKIKDAQKDGVVPKKKEAENNAA